MYYLHPAGKVLDNLVPLSQPTSTTMYSQDPHHTYCIVLERRCGTSVGLTFDFFYVISFIRNDGQYVYITSMLENSLQILIHI